MRVAIAGGNGFIGRELTSQLVDAGHEVVWLSHRPGRRAIPVGVTEVPFTYEDPDALWAAETRMADAVVNLSGYPIASYWTKGRRAKLRASRLETTDALVRQIAAAPRGTRPRVFVSASAVGIYGESRERVLTEGSPLGDDFLATLAFDWEDAACTAEECGCRVVMIRNGIVLGSEGILPRMLLPMRLLTGGPIGDGRQWVSWVHVADIAGLYRYALEHTDISGALNACAPAPVRMGTLAAELGHVIHRPSWLRIPLSVLELVLGDVAQYMVMSQRMSAEKAIAGGYEFRFPRLNEALQDLVGRPYPAEKPAEPEQTPEADAGVAAAAVPAAAAVAEVAVEPEVMVVTTASPEAEPAAAETAGAVEEPTAVAEPSEADAIEAGDAPEPEAAEAVADSDSEHDSAEHLQPAASPEAPDGVDVSLRPELRGAAS